MNIQNKLARIFRGEDIYIMSFQPETDTQYDKQLWLTDFQQAYALQTSKSVPKLERNDFVQKWNDYKSTEDIPARGWSTNQFATSGEILEPDEIHGNTMEAMAKQITRVNFGDKEKAQFIPLVYDLENGNRQHYFKTNDYIGHIPKSTREIFEMYIEKFSGLNFGLYTPEGTKFDTYLLAIKDDKDRPQALVVPQGDVQTKEQWREQNDLADSMISTMNNPRIEGVVVSEEETSPTNGKSETPETGIEPINLKDLPDKFNGWELEEKDHGAVIAKSYMNIDDQDDLGKFIVLDYIPGEEKWVLSRNLAEKDWACSENGLEEKDNLEAFDTGTPSKNSDNSPFDTREEGLRNFFKALVTEPKIGEVDSQALSDHSSPYSTYLGPVSRLTQVDGIGDKTIERFRDAGIKRLRHVELLNDSDINCLSRFSMQNYSDAVEFIGEWKRGRLDSGKDWILHHFYQSWRVKKPEAELEFVESEGKTKSKPVSKPEWIKDVRQALDSLSQSDWNYMIEGSDYPAIFIRDKNIETGRAMSFDKELSKTAIKDLFQDLSSTDYIITGFTPGDFFELTEDNKEKLITSFTYRRNQFDYSEKKPGPETEETESEPEKLSVEEQIINGRDYVQDKVEPEDIAPFKQFDPVEVNLDDEKFKWELWYPKSTHVGAEWSQLVVETYTSTKGTKARIVLYSIGPLGYILDEKSWSSYTIDRNMIDAIRDRGGYVVDKIQTAIKRTDKVAKGHKEVEDFGEEDLPSPKLASRDIGEWQAVKQQVKEDTDRTFDLKAGLWERGNERYELIDESELTERKKDWVIVYKNNLKVSVDGFLTGVKARKTAFNFLNSNPEGIREGVIDKFQEIKGVGKKRAYKLAILGHTSIGEIEETIEGEHKYREEPTEKILTEQAKESISRTYKTQDRLSKQEAYYESQFYKTDTTVTEPQDSEIVINEFNKIEDYLKSLDRWNFETVERKDWAVEKELRGDLLVFETEHWEPRGKAPDQGHRIVIKWVEPEQNKGFYQMNSNINELNQVKTTDVKTLLPEIKDYFKPESEPEPESKPEPEPEFDPLTEQEIDQMSDYELAQEQNYYSKRLTNASQAGDKKEVEFCQDQIDKIIKELDRREPEPDPQTTEPEPESESTETIGEIPDEAVESKPERIYDYAREIGINKDMVEPGQWEDIPVGVRRQIGAGSGPYKQGHGIDEVAAKFDVSEEQVIESLNKGNLKTERQGKAKDEIAEEFERYLEKERAKREDEKFGPVPKGFPDKPDYTPEQMKELARIKGGTFAESVDKLDEADLLIQEFNDLTKNELRSVKGIGPKIMEEIRSERPLTRADVELVLREIWGIGREKARAIIDVLEKRVD